MTTSKKKHTGWAVSVSIGVHVALLMAAVRLSTPAGKDSAPPVQIEILSAPTEDIAEHPARKTEAPDASSFKKNAPGDDASTSPVPSTGPRQSSRVDKPSRDKPSPKATAEFKTPSAEREPDAPGPDAKTAEARQPSESRPALRTRLQFSDYESMTGDDAVNARNQFARQSAEKRRSHNGFAPTSKKLVAALKNRRSVLIGANVLPIGNKMTLVSTYLQAIHKKLAPRFSTFLNTLDSPSERMHKKVQNSPLKYNPFYVPPPETERQRTLHGPMNDLSTRATAEFEILPNGSLAEVRLVKSSKYTLFDSAAIDAVLQSTPFAPPPPALLSGNNRSYLRWTFSRDWKKNTWTQGHLYLIGPDADTETSTE
jgi:TonB family protein